MTTGAIAACPAVLGDARRARRLARLVTLLTARAEATLAQALGSWGELKAAYRCFATRQVTPQAIVASGWPALVSRCAGLDTVLVVQDTTPLDFSHHPGTYGLGPVGTRAQRTVGLLVHTALAVHPDGGVLGLAAQRVWRRDPAQRGQTPPRRTRPSAQKESVRWGETEAASRAALPAGVRTVTVADREADLFALFAAPRPATAQLLIRAAQLQRGVGAGVALAAAAAAAPVWGRYQVTVPETPTRPARTAVCTLQVTPLTLQPPQNQRAGEHWPQPVPVTVLRVAEVAPPAGVAPLGWVLLTTLAVPDLAAAAQCVCWYSLRWLIERYHYVLKSGCRVEDLQLSRAVRLERAVAVYSLVAVQVLWLTYLARGQPDLPCTVALSTAEWQTLHRATQPRTPLPPSPPSLQEAARAVAKLGGFLGRRHDGQPGPLSLWRGLARLRDLTLGYHLAHAPPPVIPCG